MQINLLLLCMDEKVQYLLKAFEYLYLLDYYYLEREAPICVKQPDPKLKKVSDNVV